MAFKVRTGQVAALRRGALDRFAEELVAHGRAHFPTVAATAGDEGLRRVADISIDRARARGFKSMAALRCWFETALLLGLEFDEDPAYADLAAAWDKDAARAALQPPEDGGEISGTVSGDGEPDEILMMDALHDDCWAFLDKAAGPDFAELYRALARLRQLLAPGEDGAPPIDRVRSLEDMARMCARVMPSKAEALGEAGLERALTAAARDAAAQGFEGGARALCALAAFIAGSGFMRDPALGLAGKAPGDALPPADAGPEARDAALRCAVGDTARRLVEAARAEAAAPDGGR